MMSLYYEGSDGTIIDFMSDGIYAQDPETLTESSWKYTTISGINGLGKVKRFYKDVQEAPLKLSIMASDASEFNDIMYKLHRTFERDIRRMKPGKLWWNGFYKEVFVIDNSHNDFDELFESVEKEITVMSVYPYWVKKKTFQYLLGVGEDGTLDYPYDYGFDYDHSEYVEVVDNDCIESANFQIVFYGPSNAPTVTVGNHEYELLTTLGVGEYAVIDSVIKKIFKYGASGEKENIFHLRNKESYIFEKIPEGTTAILRAKDLSVDITIFDERGEPEWI